MPRKPFARQRMAKSRLSDRAALVAVLGVGLLLATGCGGSTPSTTSSKTLAVAPVEHAIQLSILKQRGIKTPVSCPANSPLKTGYRFQCNALLNVGAYPVTVIETNTAGGVSYVNKAPLRVLDSPAIESAIRLAVRHQRHLSATVSCPKLILEAKGLSFTCTIKTKRGLGKFSVTEVDEHGHVTFVGR